VIARSRVRKKKGLEKAPLEDANGRLGRHGRCTCVDVKTMTAGMKKGFEGKKGLGGGGLLISDADRDEANDGKNGGRNCCLNQKNSARKGGGGFVVHRLKNGLLRKGRGAKALYQQYNLGGGREWVKEGKPTWL